MGRVAFGKKIIDYSIKRGNRRKTLAISITPASSVIVLAPHFLNEDKIEKIVKNKSRRILEKQNYFKRLSEQYPEKEFVSGEQILFLGRKYRLKLRSNKGEQIGSPVLSGRRISIFVDNQNNHRDIKQQIKNMLTDWFADKAEKILRQRIKRYANLLGVSPAGIKIKEQKKQWGSCSRNGILRFNWRIAMAPISIIDYIVVHELSHLKVKNHSADFWRSISLVLRDYQNRRKWLRDNSAAFKL